MRPWLVSIAWLLGALVLGFVLARYASGGMALAFLHRLPGCL